MKLKRLVEDKTLIETYNVDDSAIDFVRQFFKTIGETRGNGVLCQALCSICEDKLGTNLNPKDYIVHHLNGDHNDNNYWNLVLIKKSIIAVHFEIHEQAIRSAISKMMFDLYRFPSSYNITDIDIARLTPLQKMKLFYLTTNMMDIVTSRKERSVGSLEIILMRDII